MDSKLRKSKSLSSFQHSSNKKSEWDEVDHDDDESISNTEEPILTLSDGIVVRAVRRSDANAIFEALSDPSISYCYLDTVYAQPFHLWQAHQLIDEKLDRKKSWRRRNPSTSSCTLSQDAAYEQAVRALAGMSLEDRLAKKEQHITGNPTSVNSATKKQKPLIPTCYAIVQDAVMIGLIEIEFEDPLTPDSDADDPSDPALLHQAEISYWISAKYRKRGIMSNVLQHFLSWSWSNFAQLERIDAGVYATWNPASCRVLEKCGFAREGSWVGGIRKNGKFGNIDLYSAVRSGGKVEQFQQSRAKIE